MAHISRPTKKFEISAVISITSGLMVSAEGMGGIYQVLSWMAGESVFTHQIPRIRGEAAPLILAMHPGLEMAHAEAAAVKSQDDLGTALPIWQARYGAEIDVPLMTIDEHERIDPESELAEKVHPSKIIRF